MTRSVRGWPKALLGAALAAGLCLGGARPMAASMQVVTDRWIPYENLSDADAPGFTTEVVRQVFAMMGEQVSIEELPWARAAEMVFRGERDALFTAFHSEERARYCHFPKEPVARDEWVFFVRTGDAGRLKFSSFDDLVGYQIAAVRGASISSEFWDFVRRNGNVTETVTDDANFRLLDAGRVDYVVASLVNGRRLIASLGLDGKVQPLEARSIKQDDLHIIFSKQRVSPEFVDRFSDALRRFKQTAAFQAIYRKYFHATPQESGARP